MAAEDTITSEPVSEAHPMKGGDGANSYAKNSTFQKGAVDNAKQLLNKVIAEKLDLEILSSPSSFHIADLGCSVGPNTFSAVENIIEAVVLKYHSQLGLNSQIPEFQVFFNDHTSNDFNLLFKSLPQNRQYYAAGVPGSFYDRRFPEASLHLVHSSTSLHWLSKVPAEVLDKNSLAYNKGRIHYSNATDEVIRAHETQYAVDMECFLHSRAQEVVYGGLMVLNIPGRPDGTTHSYPFTKVTLQLLGSCLMDLVEKGVVSEEKVDSFNIPMYTMSPQELKAVVERNGCFSIETITQLPLVVLADRPNMALPQLLAAHMRAGMEGIVKEHFGEEILDELFDLYLTKCEEHATAVETVTFLVVLKRKAD
ncbi:loganic acid O-methyltransferase-like [Rosa sericea]